MVERFIMCVASASFVIREFFAELGAAAVEAGLDGAAGDLQDVGDLLVGQALDLAEEEGFAEVGGEGADDLEEVETLVDGGGRRGGAELLIEEAAGVLAGGVVGRGAVEGEGAAGVAFLVPELGGAADEDAGEPGLDRGAAVEGFEPAEGGGEGFLAEVFGVEAVAGEREGKSE